MQTMFVTNPEIPKGFLNDENVMIWPKVNSKLSKINFQDKQLKNEIMSIHGQWEDALTEIEEAERKADNAEHSQCRCNQHGNPCRETATKIVKATEEHNKEDPETEPNTGFQSEVMDIEQDQPQGVKTT